MVPRKLFILAGLAALALGGCNREAKSEGPADRSEDRRASVESLKRQLDEASDRLQALEDRASRAGSKARQELRDEIAALEQARDKLHGKLENLQSAGAEGWERLKDDAARGVDSLGQAVNRTWKNLTDGDRSAEADAEAKDR